MDKEIEELGDRLLGAIAQLEEDAQRTALWDALPILYCETRGYTWSYANRALREFLGFDLTAITVEEWYDRVVHPDHRAAAIAYYGRGLAHGPSYQPLHSWIRDAGGTYHEVLWYATIDAELQRGAAVGILVTEVENARK